MKVEVGHKNIFWIPSDIDHLKEREDFSQHEHHVMDS